jgi:hypothetical protein
MTLRILPVVLILASMNIVFAAPDDAVAPGSTAAPDAYQIAYTSNPTIGDNYINITNNGSRGGYDVGSTGGALGGICVNVYAFDPSEEMFPAAPVTFRLMASSRPSSRI